MFENFSFMLFTGILASLAFCLLAAHFIFTLLTLVFKGAPYVPTPKRRIKEILELAEVNDETISLDLGSGDGRIVRAFAKAGAKKSIGLELNPIIYLLSKIITWDKNAEIRIENIWNYNLAEIDVISVFFVPTFIDKLEEKIVNEMKKGTKVISYRYKFKNLEEIKNINKLYLYEV